MILPTVHTNGTSREELLKQFLEAHRKVNEAIGCLSAAYPHGRDYYPQGETAIYKAMEEHADRVKRLRGVMAELEILMEAVS